MSYDAAPPSVTFDNNLDQAVVAVVERIDGEYPTSVPAAQENTTVVWECHGEAIRVETEAGELIGRVEEPACPGWLLTIHEDGAITYVED